MLREENKRPVRVRVCGDVARFVDAEELECLDLEEEQPGIAVVIEHGKVRRMQTLLIDDEQEAA
jgi:hypothetical protein